MVSPERSEALKDPLVVLRTLFASHHGPLDGFPSVASKHFDSLFADEDAFLQIPALSVSRPPGMQGSALVRFRGMVQNTMQREFYAGTYVAEGKVQLGGWGLSDSITFSEDLDDADFSNLLDRDSLWVVSVPGESDWLNERPRYQIRVFEEFIEALNHNIPDAAPSQPPILPHKYPTNENHIGVQVKIYDPLTAQYKITQVVTFVGILTSSSLSTSDFDVDQSPTIEVPTLHVLFSRTHPRSIHPFPFPISPAITPRSTNGEGDVVSPRDRIADLRDELLSWIADEALYGDLLVAEWVLLVICSRVQSREPQVLPPSLTISNFPLGPPGSEPPALYTVMEALVPSMVSLTFPLNLDCWSETQPQASVYFAPRSVNEDLHSGVLQLPAGTILTVIENDIKEGSLPIRSAENLQVLRNLLRTQTLEYQYPFTSAGNAYEFRTDNPVVVLTEGKRSVFLSDTDINVPLKVRPGPTDDLFKPKSKVSMLAPEQMTAFRALTCGAINGSVKISQSVAKYIEDDFVKARAQSKEGAPKITPEDLILRMNLARLMALTFHEAEINSEIWDRVTALDEARSERLRGNI